MFIEDSLVAMSSQKQKHCRLTNYTTFNGYSYINRLEGRISKQPGVSYPLMVQKFLKSLTSFVRMLMKPLLACNV